MITLAQALTADSFHYGNCTRKVGPRGGVTVKVVSCRRNGATQTWKTRPTEFRVPIKYGLYQYGEVTHDNAGCWHAPEDCPLVAQQP
jgi:hypothetical protein